MFDPATRELLRGGQATHLSPKAFEFLGLLLAQRPRAVAKTEILERLWPDTFVADASLASLAKEVRRALGDDSRAPRFVRTVFGFGYAFSGVTFEAPTAAGRTPVRAESHCRLRWGKREIPLSEGENVLGRTEDAVVWIESSSVSRRHARVVVSEGRATVEDLGSKNGTFVGAVRVADATPLVDGDTIRLGSILMKFRSFTADTTGSMASG